MTWIRTAGLLSVLSLLATACATGGLAPSPGRERPLPETIFTGEVAAATRDLTLAPESQRPPLLLKRGLAAVDAAQNLRLEKADVMGGFPWPPDAERYLEFYLLAGNDFAEIVDAFPASAEAPEAQYLLGLINDYPHLNDFEEALKAYRLAVTRYPQTEAARKAAARVEIIEAIQRGMGGSPHDQVLPAK